MVNTKPKASELISIFYDKLNELPIRKEITRNGPIEYINPQDVMRLKNYLLSMYAVVKDKEESDECISKDED